MHARPRPQPITFMRTIEALMMRPDCQPKQKAQLQETRVALQVGIGWS